MTDIMTIHEPRGWVLYRLGQLFEERKEKVSDKDYPPLSVTMNGIVPQLETAAKSDDSDNRKLVKKGDYVINSRSDRKGSGGISPHDGSVSLISIVLRPKGVHPRFAHHLLRSRAFQEEFYRWGHGIVADLWTTRYADMKNIRLFLPDLETQKAIADFLDRETTRIDQLIEKKQRLVEVQRFRLQSKLKELVLGGASVQRGLGGDWLQDLPNGWRLIPLKHLVFVKGGATPSKEREDFWVGDIPWVSPKDMKLDVIHDATDHVSEAAVANSAIQVIPEQAVLIVVRGMILARIVPVCRLGVPATINQDMKALLPREKAIRGDYLQRMLQGFGDILMSFIEEAAHGTKKLRSDALFGLKFPVPPMEVQEQTVGEYERSRVWTDSVSDLTLSSIESLRELRSALITAAVTGQIDVATWGKQGKTDRRLDQIEEEMSAEEALA